MSGLEHDFFLLSNKDYKDSFSDYKNLINNNSLSVKLEDNFLHYITDTLMWIPTYNPSKNQDCYGLCMYGVIIIDTKGASSTMTILETWANLFNQAPKNLTITGDWFYHTDKNGNPCDEGEYEHLQFDRDIIVSKLRQIANYARQVINSNGEFFILHIGI